MIAARVVLTGIVRLWRPSPEKRGGLNGSTQHLLEVSFKESTRLISFAGTKPNKTKALFRF
jgi:hypothetical protein